MTAAGIDRTTPDPDPGSQYFVRDEDGTPTGYCLEGANVPCSAGSGSSRSTANRDLQKLTLDLRRRGASRRCSRPASSSAATSTPSPCTPSFVERDHRGELPIRDLGLVLEPRGHPRRPARAGVAPARLEPRYRSENLSISTMKIWSDGTMLGRFAAARAYADPRRAAGHTHIPGPRSPG